MTKTLIIANWKMSPQSLIEAKQLFNSIKRGIKNIKNTYPELSRRVEVVICPPFIYLPHLAFCGKPSRGSISFGAQDTFWEEKGAFTGEISPLMLKNLRCEYVIIGHSERRKFGESDEMINKKIKAVIEVKLKPILCIGETERERKQGKTNQVLKSQLEKDLKSVLNLKSKILNLIIAYEPVWAIGTGNPCNPSEAKKIALFLRKIFRKNQILYGGSVNSENAAIYIKEAGFSGLLVGGASLNPQEFVKLVKNISQT